MTKCELDIKYEILTAVSSESRPSSSSNAGATVAAGRTAAGRAREPGGGDPGAVSCQVRHSHERPSRIGRCGRAVVDRMRGARVVVGGGAV